MIKKIKQKINKKIRCALRIFSLRMCPSSSTKESKKFVDIPWDLLYPILICMLKEALKF
jgi:hypothetical protein